MKTSKKIGFIAAPIAIALTLAYYPETEETVAPTEPRIVPFEEMAGANLTQFIAYKESYKMVNGQMIPYYPGISMIEFYDNGYFRIFKQGEIYCVDTFPADEVKDLEILYAPQ